MRVYIRNRCVQKTAALRRSVRCGLWSTRPVYLAPVDRQSPSCQPQILNRVGSRRRLLWRNYSLCMYRVHCGSPNLKTYKCACTFTRFAPLVFLLPTPLPRTLLGILRLKDHKQEGMVDTKHKTCAHPGCPLLPSMGVAVDQDTVNTIPASGQRSTSTLRSGKASARYCAAHAPEGSTNVTARRCRHPGCNVQPTFGREGAGEAPSFCARHRKPGMTDVLNPRCHARGCVAQPRCGRVGDPRPTFCLHHADPDMVNVRRAA